MAQKAQKAEASKEPDTLKELAEAQPSEFPEAEAAKEEEETTSLEPAPSEKKLYRLTQRFWDNRVLHQPGDQLYFAEGKAPRSAKLVE